MSQIIDQKITDLAQQIADECILKIKAKAPNIQTDEFSNSLYKEKCVLEEVVRILNDKI